MMLTMTLLITTSWPWAWRGRWRAGIVYFEAPASGRFGAGFPRRWSGFSVGRSPASSALGERCHGVLSGRSIAVHWRAIFVVREDQCPHPWPCNGHARLKDTADNLAVRNHIEIVVVPGRPTKRPVKQVVFLHSLFFLAQTPWCVLVDRPTSPSAYWPAIVYNRIGTGTPSAVPSSSNFPASSFGLGLIAQSYRAFSSPPLGGGTDVPAPANPSPCWEHR